MTHVLLDDNQETSQFALDETRQHAATPQTQEWSYEEAFSRNLGLINPEEQQKLRNSRIAIAGMGGVGGIHLITLARLGIGKFTIADPDTFEVANTNRQYGARVDTIGRSKAHVMADEVRRINPEAEIDVVEGGISMATVPSFLDKADLFVDGMDLFEMDLRRQLFVQSAHNGIYATTAAPMGFSVAWTSFAPGGPSFDRFFGLNDRMTELEKVVSLAIGLAPAATHRTYLDLSQVNINKKHGPSTSAACHLAAGVIASQAVKILLKRGVPEVAPRCFQFDAYRGILRRRTLILGNRGPLQRTKRWALMRFAERLNGA